MERLVALDDPEAIDPSVVGAKAANLARARAAGLPVLPGLVVPVRLFRSVLERAEQLVPSSGVHAAQLDVSMRAPDAELLAELASFAVPLGDTYVCRSSSVAEGDPSWSGALASLLDVRRDELGTAISACVASVFSPFVATWLAERGGSFSAVAPSVLVQRHISPRASGTARHAGDGGVRIVAVDGHPAPLLAGWARGAEARVSTAGDVDGPAAASVGVESLCGVARLLRELGEDEGTAIEWAVSDGGIVLLQVSAFAPSPKWAAARRSPRPRRPPLAPDTRPIARRTATIVARCAGPAGERWLLPWAIAPGAPEGFPEEITPLAEDALAVIEREARTLNATSLLGCARRGDALIAALANRCSDADLRELMGLRAVDAASASALCGQIAALEAELRSHGSLGAHTSILRIDPAELAEESTETNRSALRPVAAPLQRWQRLLQLSLLSNGELVKAEPVSPGTVAGIARRVGGAGSLEALAPGDVALVDQALPRYSPLCWRAAAIVSISGSGEAHLFEVARSRRVPAVIAGLDQSQAGALDGELVLVDGDEGGLVFDPGARRTHLVG